MSLATPELDKSRVVLTVDPRIDFHKDGVFAIGAAGERVTYRNIQTQNFSASNISITDKQSMGIAIASKWFMRVTFNITVSGTPPAGAYLVQVGSNDAARFMPLTSVTKTITVDLNDEKFTTGINDYHDALLRYNESDDAMGFDFSTCPSFLDTYQSYDDYRQFGSALNPLGNYGENSIQEPLRGGFEYTYWSIGLDGKKSARLPAPPVGDGVTPLSCIVEFTTREPILLSPLTWGHYNTKALIGIKSFAVNYDFDSNISRIWSHNPDNGVVNFNVSNVIPTFSALELIYITPKSTIPVFPIQRYPLAGVYKVTKALGNISAGETTPVIMSDSMPLYGVPKRAYIFARRSNETRTYNDPDVFGQIDKLSIYFNNSDGNFSQASIQQLYQVSRENGYRRPYQAFSKYEGSVMCIDFGKDMPLLPNEGVGSNENIQFQYNFTLKNLSQETINYSLFTIVIFEGIMTIRNGVIIRELNIVSPKDIVDSQIVQMLPHEREVDYYAVGGAFGSNARKFMDRAKSVGKKVIDVGQKAYAAIPSETKKDIGRAALGLVDVAAPRVGELIKDYGPIVADVYNALKGQGWSEDDIYAELIGRGYVPKRKAHKKGGAVEGGRKMTKKELHKLLA